MFYSDLHIHSRYSRATSKKLNFPNLYYWGTIKGLNLIGTGDIFHAKWIKEFKDHLVYDDNTGFYPFNQALLNPSSFDSEELFQKYKIQSSVQFIPTVETSHIYKHKDKVRRVHLVTVFKTIQAALKIAIYLKDHGVNLYSDGRPIMGISAKNYLAILLDLLKEDQFILFPAHIWTPWYALFGSKSGYDNIQDAFEDLTPYITALETGLSSDPKMNRMLPELDRFVLISNSDAHSAQRLGREANIHTKLDNVNTLFETLRTGKHLHGTIEFYPEEGRYHYDGHRKCNIHFHPKQSIKNKGICPVCHKPLTLGVLYRVLSLSSTKKVNQQLLEKYPSYYIVPLQTIVGQVLNKPETSIYVYRFYQDTLLSLGTEIDVLLNIPIKQIAKYNEKLACLIHNMRIGKLNIQPGYDGVYGQVKIDSSNCNSSNFDKGITTPKNIQNNKNTQNKNKDIYQPSLI